MTTNEKHINAILRKKSRRVRVSGFVSLLMTVGFLFFIQHKIDSTSSILQGSGWLIWPILAVLFLLIWKANKNVSGMISSTKDVCDARELAFDPTADPSERMNAITLLQSCIRVCKTCGVDFENFRIYIRNNKDINAGAAGIGKKVILVNTGTFSEVTGDELDAMIAHEIGHSEAKHTSFLALLTSYSCLVNLLGGAFFIAAIFIWGWSFAWLIFVLSSFVLPFFINSSGDAQEDLADAYATAYGYGPGLISFFKKFVKSKDLDPFTDWAINLLGNHPPFYARIHQIEMMVNGDEGLISDDTELAIWNLVKLALIVVGAFVLAQGQWEVQTVLNVPVAYLAASAWFYLADLLLNSSQVTYLPGKQKTELNAAAMVSLFIVIGLYAAGLVAALQFKNMTGWEQLGNAALVVWIAKPITAVLGKIDLFGLLSDMLTYIQIILSLAMIVSFFIHLYI